MLRENANDLVAFVAVAREGSFTRAAARLGVSQSALSHAMRGLETRLGIRLLTRTTRSLALTDAGERLLRTVAPAFEDIDAELQALGALRDKPAGSFRITAGQHAVDSVIWPVLSKLLPDYPDIKVELAIDAALTDIVSERFDAGVRLGESLEKDMIAVRVSPEMRMVLLAAPSYLAKHPPPQAPRDLTAHNCINLRLPTYGGLYAWEFEKDGQELRVRVEGQLTFNTPSNVLRAAADGMGLAFMLEDAAKDYLADGRLLRLMEDWCPPFPGYHLYYPSRRQPSPAFTLLVEALRYRG
ncbi:MAG: LysR family transcriptional regulator [Kaistia sp. SCN 65-12]|nr:MAG: LysR family transcriptional regulator [Kaistia sp. SCN 65-12]